MPGRNENENGTQSVFRIHVNPSGDLPAAFQNRNSFLNPNVMASVVAGAIALQTVEAFERFGDVREGHDLTEDLALRNIKHGREPETLAVRYPISLLYALQLSLNLSISTPL